MAKKARYCLAAPKPTLREVYLKDLQVHLLCGVGLNFYEFL